MVTSHIKGEEKDSSQSDSRSKQDTESANKTKTLVRTVQVYGACEATMCIRTQQGELGREAQRGSFH